MNKSIEYLRWFDTVTVEDITTVGGKNASLGEMIQALSEKGIQVPGGFATTADAYREFMEVNNLTTPVSEQLKKFKNKKITLAEAGANIRELFLKGEFSDGFKTAISEAYRQLGKKYKKEQVDVAVRSSATAEDLPKASFAGQQESYLNIHGEKKLLEACKKCYASLFTDRAITYREEKGFDHLEIALSIGIQKMIRSDKASSGVMFTIDTETGFPDVIVIDGTWGLGEYVVKGVVNPDEFRLFKPLLSDKKNKPIIERGLGSKERKLVYATNGKNTTKDLKTSTDERNKFVLNDDEILKLGRWANIIEEHYDRPMDIEWAKDGESGKLFIVQARPETVESQKEATSLKTYTLKEHKEPLVKGLSIGDAIATGSACVIKNVEEIDQFVDHSILVTDMTDPDWVPVMKRASGIITDHGGRTSHAAIISRELGIPAVVGTGDATEKIKDKDEITLSCAEGDEGFVYKGLLKYEEKKVNLENLPETKTQIMMNIASPAAAFRWWRLPSKGVGLARMEFIINNIIKIHPMALVRYPDLKDKSAKKKIESLTKGYQDKTQYFVDHLSSGIAQIAASQYPDPVIVRMSDFKTNEYAKLIGGLEFEPDEENPMLGFRGASRYYSDRYREGFALECRAIREVRETMGLKNVIVMIPFCRTTEEADRVLKEMARHGLKRGKDGLEIYVMSEIPSNVILADKFAERFDGYSIGSNDLTQLVLGADRDSDLLSDIFDERNEAVKRMIRDLIKTAHQYHVKVGICGQAPSDYPEFASFLVEAGIDSMSLNPDSVIGVIRRIAKTEKRLKKGREVAKAG